MEEPIIQTCHLSKAYRLYEKKSDRVREVLSLSGKQYHQPFYALKDVSFSISAGETIGIIGTNGSGKSTLLKILTGVTAPSEGSAAVHGRVSALLELGTGFNPEYTGIENIELYCTMQGCSQEESTRKRKEIIDFAEIGDYIHQPVKNYSSGMFARLAFAAAINVEPEILIVDEVLSVGDMRFQIKCMDRMKSMMEGGTTILFVSHDLSSVRRFCKRSIWLNQGRLQMIGESNRVCDAYADFLNCWHPSPKGQQEECIDKNTVDRPFIDPASGQIAEIIEFQISKADANVEAFYYDEPISITVTYDVYDEAIEDPVLGVALFSIDGRYVCGLNTLLDGQRIPWRYGRNHFTIDYPQGLRVLGGVYYFDAALRDKTATVNIDYQKIIHTITISSGYVAEGLFVLPHRWRLPDM